VGLEEVDTGGQFVTLPDAPAAGPAGDLAEIRLSGRGDEELRMEDAVSGVRECSDRAGDLVDQ
jgi:hypothetical protein